jgi:hypothetical protein
VQYTGLRPSGWNGTIVGSPSTAQIAGYNFFSPPLADFPPETGPPSAGFPNFGSRFLSLSGD